MSIYSKHKTNLFLGYFTNLAELQAQYPVGEDGQYAGVNDSKKKYYWDVSSRTWEDSGENYTGVLQVSDIEIGAVEIKDGGTDARANVLPANTARTTSTNVVAVQEIGADGTVPPTGSLNTNAPFAKLTDGTNNASINSSGELKVTGSPTTIADYKSPDDFTVTYTSASTVTITGLPFTLTTGVQIAYIKVRNSSTNLTTVYVNGGGGYAFGHSAGVVTAYLNGVAASIFTANDMYEMGVNAQTKAYDPSTNSMMESELNPVWERYTDVELLVSAQDLTNAYADFGAEIDMRGYSVLGVYVISDVNDSLNVTLKALAKHTSEGTDEYELEANGSKVLWTTGAADAKVYYEFEVGSIPFIQLQAIAGTVGATAGDLTISIIKKY